MLADMKTEVEAARLLLYEAARKCDEGSPDVTLWAAMAKLKCGDVAMSVTTDAVQVLGGFGYSAEYPVERMMRDAKITQIYEGTQQIQRLVISRRSSARANPKRKSLASPERGASRGERTFRPRLALASVYHPIMGGGVYNE